MTLRLDYSPALERYVLDVDGRALGLFRRRWTARLVGYGAVALRGFDLAARAAILAFYRRRDRQEGR